MKKFKKGDEIQDNWYKIKVTEVDTPRGPFEGTIIGVVTPTDLELQHSAVGGHYVAAGTKQYKKIKK